MIKKSDGYFDLTAESTMSVLQEILQWSKDRPDWQRDALRRLVTKVSLNNEDFEELVELCKAAYGLSEKEIKPVPLDKTHISESFSNSGKVILRSVSHFRGVNALAENQKIEFGSNLTVIYGDNASGKSGYTRILKSACKARGHEEILGNVLSDSVPSKPSISIQYNINDGDEIHEWAQGDDNLNRVNVFDTRSASIYLKERTDVAFRPFGLDLFDKLSVCCEEIGKRIEKEITLLNRDEIILPDFPEGTQARKLILSLSSLTKPETVTLLATLNPPEKEQLLLLQKSLDDLKSENPTKEAGVMGLRADRIDELLNHLQSIERVLSDEFVQKLFDKQKTTRENQDEAKRVREKAIATELLIGTGSDLWKQMWKAAEEFSSKEAYKEHSFPFTSEDSKCVLCQRDLDSSAAQRLINFQEYVLSKMEQAFSKSRQEYQSFYDQLNTLKVKSGTNDNYIQEINIDAEHVAQEIVSYLEAAEKRQSLILSALHELSGLPSDLPKYPLVEEKIRKLVEQLRKRAKELATPIDQAKKEELTRSYNELKSREALGVIRTSVLAVIDRKAKLAAYELCLRDTRTNNITRKSTEITKDVVTEKLQSSFRTELERLKFSHVEVELQEAGGERGALYHRLILKRAPSIEVPKVVSEGEARCLSIVAFFAELSTADDLSAILFDDPVSSLDHKWRSIIAKRLVEEAKTRQVILFTHDIVFLLALHREADKSRVDLQDQHLSRERIGAGVCSTELPWVAMKVKKRLGVLKNDLQENRKLFKDGNRQEYERNATLIYGRLRETWERAFEEVLLNGMVERYRESIQTQQIHSLSDITEDDCTTFQEGMTKCSKWLPGHDLAAAENEEVPPPDELEKDIFSLENWVSTINKRRK